MEPVRYHHRTALASVVFVGLVVGTVLSGAISTYAQVGPMLSIRPWYEKPMWAETFDEIVIFDRGHTKGADESIKNFYWDSGGRIKFWKDDPAPPFTLGYRILTIDTDSDNEFLDGQWNDVSVAAAKQFGPILDSDWNLGLVAGIGTANDAHWSNGDALYGLGTIDLWTPVSEEASIHTGIYYDGNRGLFQDIPLPFFTYQHRVTDKFDLAIGIPDTLIMYELTEKLSLSAWYHFHQDVRLRFDYEMVEDSGVYLFALYTRAVRQFYLEEQDNRRLFYELDRAAAGVRWKTKWFDASFGVGYTFNSRYRTGWDIRDLDTVRDLSEEVYASIALQGTFP